MLVAHFSDLHLLSLEGVHALDFVGKRATGGVNLLFNRGGKYPEAVARALVADVREQKADHVVVSGDLTNLAFPAEFELVRAVLERLEMPPSRVTVVPGNHDRYTRRAASLDHFGRIMAPFLEGPFPSLRLQDELAVVALDSAHPTPPLMAYGTVGARQLNRAAELLVGEECRRRFRLVVLHHPPHMEHVTWHNRLTDREAFTRMIARAGADLVIHGHLHRLIRQQIAGPDGPVPVFGAGSGTWLAPDEPDRRAQYNLYRIEGRRLEETSTRRYDLTSGRFQLLSR